MLSGRRRGRARPGPRGSGPRTRSRSRRWARAWPPGAAWTRSQRTRADACRSPLPGRVVAAASAFDVDRSLVPDVVDRHGDGRQPATEAPGAFCDRPVGRASRPPRATPARRSPLRSLLEVFEVPRAVGDPGLAAVPVSPAATLNQWAPSRRLTARSHSCPSTSSGSPPKPHGRAPTPLSITTVESSSSSLRCPCIVPASGGSVRLSMIPAMDTNTAASINCKPPERMSAIIAGGIETTPSWKTTLRLRGRGSPNRRSPRNSRRRTSPAPGPCRRSSPPRRPCRARRDARAGGALPRPAERRRTGLAGPGVESGISPEPPWIVGSLPSCSANSALAEPPPCSLGCEPSFRRTHAYARRTSRPAPAGRTRAQAPAGQRLPSARACRLRSLRDRQRVEVDLADDGAELSLQHLLRRRKLRRGEEAYASARPIPDSRSRH